MERDVGRIHRHGDRHERPQRPAHPAQARYLGHSLYIGRLRGFLSRTALDSPPVTRLSNYFLPTVKEAPADAEAVSHRLLVRAGLARQVGAGLWTWLPAGWRAHRKVEQIIREELERDRLPRDADAGTPAGRAVEAQRPLRHRRGVQAAGPARSRAGAGAVPRGDAHVPHGARGPLVPRPPEAALPLPDEGARRGAAARRGAPHARVHHEGRLLLRPRPRGARPLLRPLRRAPTTASSTAPGSSGTGWSRTWGRWAASARTSTWRPARPARTTWRSPRRATPPTWRWPAPRAQPVDGLPEPLDAPEARGDPRRDDDRPGGGHARCARRGADQGLPDVRGRPRPGAGGDPRRPPPERDQAPECARRRRCATGGGGGGAGDVSARCRASSDRSAPAWR